LLEAVAVGYAIAGNLTDGLTPRASEAGWRLAAITAPVTAASVAAVVLDLGDDDAVSALRTAAACMGGDIRSLAGDDWRLQPGLFALAGVYAARAASGGGVGGSVGALESMAAKVLGEPWELPHHDPIPAITRVTFKQYAAPMFAQAIIAGLEGAGDIDEPVNKVVVHVAPFAAGYATDGAGRPLGVASIPDLVSAAIAEPPTRRRVPPAGERATGAHQLHHSDRIIVGRFVQRRGEHPVGRGGEGVQPCGPVEHERPDAVLIGTVHLRTLVGPVGRRQTGGAGPAPANLRPSRR
jgi:hypothetical protein